MFPQERYLYKIVGRCDVSHQNTCAPDEVSLLTVTLTGSLLPPRGHLVKFCSTRGEYYHPAGGGSGLAASHVFISCDNFKLRRQDMSYILIEIFGHLLLQVNVKWERSLYFPKSEISSLQSNPYEQYAL